MPRWFWIGFSLFTVLCASLVLYGVLTHREAGLMTACEQLSSRDYDYRGDCFEVTVMPGQVPLSVVSVILDNPAGYDAAQLTRTLTRAIRNINRDVGCELFTTQLDDDPPDVGITFNVDPDRMPPREGNNLAVGQVRHRMIRDRVEATVEVAAMQSPLMHVVVEHELGHVLGLAHDNFTASLMYHEVDARGFAPTFHRFTEADRKLLRQLYCL